MIRIVHITRASRKDKKSLAYAHSSLILAKHFPSLTEALGIMDRLVTLFILFLIPFHGYALSIVCLKAESDEQRIEWLNESFQNSQVVVQLGNPIPTDSATTKHKVLRVWKGVVGEYVYVDGGGNSGLLFTSRINSKGPLKSHQTHCHSLSSDSSKVSTLDLLKQNHGVGYEPDVTIIEPQYAKTYLDWLFMFVFVLLVIVSMITYGLVQYKSTR